MSYVYIMTGLIYVYFFSFMDVIFTFYQFCLLDKKGVRMKSLEINPVIRRIIKYGISPLKYLFATFFCFGIMTIIIKLFDYNLLVIGMMVGALGVVNSTHFANLKKFRQEWNNETYWKKMRVYFGNQDVVSR